MHTQTHKGILYRITMTAAMLLMTLTFAGCSSQVTGTCEACGKNKPLNVVTITGEASALGLSHSGSFDLCDSCLSALKKEAKEAGSVYGVTISVSSKKKTK